jgi:hypothetical protein
MLNPKTVISMRVQLKQPGGKYNKVDWFLDDSFI